MDVKSDKHNPDFSFPEALLVKDTELFDQCLNIVVGKGNESANILFVGEAPGKNEDEQGLPFVGAAGKNLDKLLDQVGLSLSDIYVANILKCRPPANRDPLPEEIRAHTPWLLKQIRDMKPKVVCSLGNYATKFFLANGEVDMMKNQPGITSVHGKPVLMSFQGLEIVLLPLFHPAAIIYNRTKLTPLWDEDMNIVKRVLSGELEVADRFEVSEKKKVRLGKGTASFSGVQGSGKQKRLF